MSNDTLDDLFSGSGAPAVTWVALGQTVAGPLTAVEARQAKDFETGDLLTWDDGRPKMEVILTIQTGQIDPTIEGDTGERRVFVRGHLFSALRDAVRAAKAPKPQVGGKVAIKWFENGEPPKKGFKAPRLFKVAYQPPAEVEVEDLFAATGQGEAPDFAQPAEEAKPAPAKKAAAKKAAAPAPAEDDTFDDLADLLGSV